MDLFSKQSPAEVATKTAGTHKHGVLFSGGHRRTAWRSSTASPFPQLLLLAACLFVLPAASKLSNGAAIIIKDLTKEPIKGLMHVLVRA
jgi:hypothetical protein